MELRDTYVSVCVLVTLWRSQAALGLPCLSGPLFPPSKSDPPSLDHPDLVCAVGVQGW